MGSENIDWRLGLHQDIIQDFQVKFS